MFIFAAACRDDAHKAWRAIQHLLVPLLAQGSQAALKGRREEAAAQRAAATTAAAKAEADIADLEEQLGKHERMQARAVTPLLA